MPDVNQMHRENTRRMDKQDDDIKRIADKQDEHAGSLSEIKTILARIDERTKRYDDHGTDIENLNTRVSDVEGEVNKAKGMGLAGTIAVGALEGIHMLLTWGKRG